MLLFSRTTENYNFLFLEAKGMQHGKEPSGMALVRLKRAAQITLPAELRKRFHLEEGDYSFQEKDFLARST
jgi:hypothetical protein